MFLVEKKGNFTKQNIKLSNEFQYLRILNGSKYIGRFVHYFMYLLA